MDRDSAGAGVADEFVEAGLNSEEAIKKHVAAPITTANFKILKCIGACFATRGDAACRFAPLSRFERGTFIDLRATLLPSLEP